MQKAAHRRRHCAKFGCLADEVARRPIVIPVFRRPAALREPMSRCERRIPAPGGRSLRADNKGAHWMLWCKIKTYDCLSLAGGGYSATLMKLAAAAAAAAADSLRVRPKPPHCRPTAAAAAAPAATLECARASVQSSSAPNWMPLHTYFFQTLTS